MDKITVAQTRKERDRLLRKSDILHAAEAVFAIKGYHKATIQDIAREAQYAIGTIYLYFRDKEALYIELIEKKLEELNREVRKEVDRTEGTEEKIKALVHRQLAYFEENKDFFKIYFLERQWIRWGARDRISKKMRDRFLKYIGYIAGLLKKAQEKGIVKQDLDTRKLAYVLASMLNAVIIPWLKDTRKEEKITNMTDFILDIFFHGIEER